MNHAITLELQFFLISILWGAILLLAYDVLRIIRRLIKHGTIILAIEDLIFWVIASIFIFAMIYDQNNGIIRGFSVMGVTIGMVLYHYILSSFLVNTITKIIQILLSPFIMAINTVKRFFHFVFLKGKKIVNFLARRLKKLKNSFKIRFNTRRQAVAAKKRKKAEQKALEKKKKDELVLAKRKAKADQKEREKQSRNHNAKNSKATGQKSGKNAADDRNNLPVTKNASEPSLISTKRRKAELSLKPTADRQANQSHKSAEMNRTIQNQKSDKDARAKQNVDPKAKQNIDTRAKQNMDTRAK